MRNTLLIYSSVDGHTQKISSKIAEHIKHHANVDLTSLVDAQSLSLINYQQVIIGASIRYGNYRKELFEYIEKNLDELSSKENAFFSVNVVARKPEKNTPDTNPYMKKFLQLTNWQPNLLGVFAGKIDYPSYKFADKQMIRLIMFITKGPTDTSGTFEFTNWKSVEEFSDRLL